MLREFRQFVMRGNVVDLAVAVVIGGAFGRIVASLVNDVLMPVLGTILGGINLTDLKVVIRAAQGETAELAIFYGAFLQSIVDFVIIAFAIFVIIRSINSMRRKREEEPAQPPAPSREEKLLEEIRDTLRASRQ